MPRLTYETADTIVYDPVAAHRNGTRAVLYTLGFRNIETCSTVDDFNLAIKKSPPDLAVCEAQGAVDELCGMIQRLRQGMAGHSNPFLVIIVTAWDKNDSLVRRVVNSGADDLVLRPFSTALLRQRIDLHIERRKGFVITHDYVGPDRRHDPTRVAPAELFQPPNSLKMKAQERLSVQEVNSRLRRELNLAKDTLHAEKLRRDAFQLCMLWRFLQEPGDDGWDPLVDQMRTVIRDVAKRCRTTEFEAATQWCDSVQAAVEGLQFAVDQQASLQLLGHAALSLMGVLDPEKSKNEHVQAVEEAMAKIQARGQAERAPLTGTGTG